MRGFDMKICVSQTHVDLEAPIQMTDEQYGTFIDFFTDMFEDVEIKEVIEAERGPPGHGEHIKWTVDDYLALLKPDDNIEIANAIGRSDMSIRMKRGSFIPEFLSWMNKKSYSEPYTREMIEEYLEEKGYQ
jgi:hypothetical protein